MRRITHHRRTTGRRRTGTAMVVAGLAVSLGLAACGSDATNSTDDDPGASPGDSEEGGWNPDTEAEVTISYSNMPPVENEENHANALRVAEEFMALHPNVTLEGEPTQWKPETFNAMLAGGTMPTIMRIPFTEIGSIMANEQAADITEAVEADEVLSGLNSELLSKATNEDGRIYGIPSFAYSLGLVYNRAVFEEAGLDPDDPPETWDEMREYAATITEETGKPGFLMMTKDVQGGWILTAMTYAFGGQMEAPEGDGYTVTTTTDATVQALDLLKTMRWEDDSLGDNFLINQLDIREEVAAGRAGMFIGGPAGFNDMVSNRGMAPEDFGAASMPQDDDGLGTLVGGNIELINPKATDEEIYWALEWEKYRAFRTRTDEQQAVDNAKARNADGLPVGNPALPLIDQASFDRYQDWIAEYINVPTENFDPYMSTVQTMPLVAEPPMKAPELYGALDPVVQAALTREDADLEAMLEQVASDVNALIAQGE